jgi:hypothetical protein
MQHWKKESKSHHHNLLYSKHNRKETKIPEPATFEGSIGKRKDSKIFQ